MGVRFVDDVGGRITVPPQQPTGKWQIMIRRILLSLIMLGPIV
jgi:hypothetical protein